VNPIDPFERYHLTRVINASGTMTALGASRTGDDAIAAMTAILPCFVGMDQLQARASMAIAEATGAEAGCVTACAAAGMALSVAAAMTGSDLARIERLPDTTGLRAEVVIGAGHLVHYGAPVAQAITLTGATVVPAGTATRVESFHLEDAISEHTAAVLFVVSHHTVQQGQAALDETIAIAHRLGVPVIVDTASEHDLTGPFAKGADLAVWSAHKFLGGPTAGIVAGRKDLVRAVYLQNRGLGRHMKVGKEGVLGTIAALEAWGRRDHAAEAAREAAILAEWETSLAGVPGLRLARHADWTGNPITRLELTLDPGAAGLEAWELADRLSGRDPAVHVRDELAEHQRLYLDPCNVTAEEARLVGAAIADEMGRALAAGDGRRMGLAERRRLAAEAARRWPDGL
jgi:L-seryl-tRNA(Ser) seleniumtransferase